jgi:hypothetical protein
METASGKETIIVLRRLIAYSEKIFQLSKDIVTLVSDRREKPRISTAAVVKSSLVLFWARMGSLNAWEQVGRARFWQCWLGEPTFSADTLGRVHALLDANSLRQGIHDVYERLKRNKALPDIYGLGVVVLDGHESHASYLHHCSGCLRRTIHGAGGDRIQFYHRQVTLLLLPGALPGRKTVRLLLDHEPQRSGEDEVETAASRSSCGGLLEMAPRTRYSPSNSYANYPAHPSLGQKRFNAPLNLPIPTSANIRCGIVA